MDEHESFESDRPGAGTGGTACKGPHDREEEGRRGAGPCKDARCVFVVDRAVVVAGGANDSSLKLRIAEAGGACDDAGQIDTLAVLNGRGRATPPLAR